MYQGMHSTEWLVVAQDHRTFGEDIIIFLTSSTVAGPDDASKEFTRGESMFTVLKV